MAILLSKYEVARLLGLRALQLDEGATACVETTAEDTSLTIAAKEIVAGRLDAVVRRGEAYHSVRDARLPRDARTMLELKAGTPVV